MMSEDPHSAEDHGVHGYMGYLNRNSVTIAEVLKEAGYHTYMSGKWHVGMHGQEKWPLQRGFDHFYGILSGACSYLQPHGDRNLTLDNQQLPPPEQPYYTTDAFTDYAIKFVDERPKDDNPFFLYLAYNAPHWPLHAKQEDIDKFVGKYRKGWQKVREARLKRMIKMGLVDKNWDLAQWEGRQWSELTEDEQIELDRRMSVYAAQVHCMDYNVGRLIKYLEEKGEGSGKVVFYGCPGEEGAATKAFMARDGVFAECDAALTWHPGNVNQVTSGTCNTCIQSEYKFTGVASHAAGAPEKGRSALDAVELMNIGVQFLREHVVPEARIHYAITNTGGYSPNVVQPYAEVLYLIRAPKNSQVEEIYRRVNKIAEGAAHMTETRVEIDFVKGCSNLMSNKVIAKELWDNLVELGAPEYTEDELKFAKAISEGVGDSRFESLEKVAKNCKDKKVKAEVLSHKGEDIYRFVAPFNPDGIMSFGSTDVGDVSWNCPTAQAYVTTWAAGTPGHSWQVVSQGKSGLAHKGLIYAAKAMAGAAVDMYEDPEIIAKAKAEMEEDLDGETYHCPIPDGCKPRALGMKM
mgnify:CR=1 FL=1